MRPEDTTIVQVSSMDRGGGAERIASDLARTLAARGFDSHLAVGHRYGSESDAHLIPNDPMRSGWARSLIARAPEPTGPHTPLTPAQRALRIGLKALAEPARTIARAAGREDFDFPGTGTLPDIAGKRADILHLHNLHGSYFDLRMLPELSHTVPTVLTAHDMWLATGHCAYSMDCDRWRNGCGSCPYPHTLPGIPRDSTHANVRIKRRIYESSSLHLVGPSQWVLDTLTASMLEPAIASATLIPNGVDTSVFEPGSKDDARASLGIAPDARVLLFSVSNEDNPYKDFRTIREALPLITASLDSDIVLLALGRFPSGAEANATVRSIPYLESAEEVALHLRATDVVVHMAHAENHPLAILEAQACGVPVVASRIGGIPETMIEGETGDLVDESDVAGLAQTVSALLCDDARRDRYSRAAVELARRRFDLDRMADDYAALYDRILTGTV